MIRRVGNMTIGDHAIREIRAYRDPRGQRNDVEGTIR